MSAAAGELHPALAPVAAEAARQPTRAGEAAAIEQGRVYSATDAGVTLSVCLVRRRSSWQVGEARYRLPEDATPELRGTLEIFCQTIEGLPLQEAADHGTIHACDRLRGPAAQALVQGIHTPRSLGAAFGRCDRLIRDILAQYRTVTGDQETRNFWNPALSQEWRLKTAEQQMETLRPIIESYQKSQDAANSDMWIARIEKMRRVIIDFGETVDAARKPVLLRELERAMRDATGERLELYMEELKDNNVIRRLGSEPTEPTRAVS
jgi:hypothetical protein